MHFKIHRGTNEIGGSCVEVWTEKTRIVIDIGMPLVEKDGSEFDFKKYSSLSVEALIKKKILPNIKGFYKRSDKLIDGVIISHAHLDHYGFSSFVHQDNKFYMGEATHKIINLTNTFTNQDLEIKNVTYFENEKPFHINDITITPYLMDHSAFDAYAFKIDSDSSSIFYTGDFRAHGRKSKLFNRFLKNPPGNIDYLLMEGTQIEREPLKEKTEAQIENEFVTLFSEPDKINLVYVSGQNIDRLVSLYRACIRTKKKLVVDVYIATVLKALSKYAKLPYPSKDYLLLKVIFTKWLSQRIAKEGKEKLLYQFRHYKITKEEIDRDAKNIVMVVRSSMKFDLERMPCIKDGNFIFSMWKGYLNKTNTKKFVDYLKSRNFKVHHVHTSGHADITTLQEIAEALKPKNIIPIHTFAKEKYKEYFNYPVKELEDGEIVKL